jgi:hypothetical protein
MRRQLCQAARKLALDFLVRHPWAQAGSGDPDLRMALAIDSLVAATGLDPAGARYWLVLEQNLRAALPHRFPDPLCIKTTLTAERMAEAMAKAARLGRIHGDAVLSLRKKANPRGAPK